MQRRRSARPRELIRRFNVKAGGPDAAAKSLSGGNLQKFIVGREIDADPKLLIVSQPTWGVDVGAAAQIRGELLALRDDGCAVLVVSEELDELFEICDRLRRDRAGPRLAEHRDGRGDDREDRRLDERPVGPARDAGEGGVRMLKLEPRARASRVDVDRLAAARARDHRRDRHRLFLLLGKDPLRGLLRCSSSSRSKSVYALTELAVKATPLILIGARPGGVLSLQRLEHRRRGPVHRRRDRRERRRDAGRQGHRALDRRRDPRSPASLGGMVWAGIVALLRDRFNANEILVSLMLVYVAEQLLGYLVYGPWKDPAGLQLPADHHAS